LNPILKDPTIQKKSTYIPGGGYNINVVKVKNLQLTRGGFMGKAVIPNVSEFVGEEYLVDAFIPGSQIVLNITDDFEQFVGKEVYAFVLNYIPKPGNSGMSLICSVKEVLKYIGELNMISMFNEWCDETEVWKGILEKTYEGKVTGIINSSKKCGVFVEIPELNITGMVQTKPEELVGYKPHAAVGVKITGFEEELFYNAAANQMQHAEPYVIENGCLKKCSLKPILSFA
jgi:ribosomal protein S1